MKKHKSIKEVLEAYFQLGIKEGHSLTALKYALLDQGVERKDISEVVKEFKKKDKEKKDKKREEERKTKLKEKEQEVKELYDSIDTNTKIGKIKFHLHKHMIIYAAVFYVVYAILLSVQAMIVWSRHI